MMTLMSKSYWIILSLLYVIFLFWYGGSGEKMTSEEIELGINTLKENMEKNGRENTEFLNYVNNLIETDDGNEFIMVNLIKYREIAKYPENSKWSKETDPMLADARYVDGLMPKLIKNGGFPLLGSTVKGKFIDEDNPEDWDVVALIRYRSVKDMMNMMIEMSETDLSQHKWASIEKTHVFPAQIQIGLFLPKILVTLIFLILASIPILIKRTKSK